MIRLANAPVSYGAFELTVGILDNVPGPDQVLEAIAAAGYEGTELGPPGYLGEDKEALRTKLQEHDLRLAAAFVPLRFEQFETDPTTLDQTLDLIEDTGAKPVLADAGPRRNVQWNRLTDGIARAADRARGRGFTPTFHHHMGSAVQGPAEIERLLGTTDVALLLDTGHLIAAGGDPVAGLRDWHDRIDHLHLKDVRLDLLRSARSWDAAWRSGVFCELGTGDADLPAFLAGLDGYNGWLVIEQDWVPAPGDDIRPQAEAQVRNRAWILEHLMSAAPARAD